ncbi:s-methyl-5-thioribose-1-phosphate isomerase, partial [Pseudomonas salomonii]
VMAQLGLERIRKHQGNAQAILTHGNAGALATGGVGTALGVIRAAFLEGLVEHVYVNETRPWLQGSRLTAWELAGEGIPATVNADSAGAHILKTKGVTWVVVGADCIAANGDVIGPIGTYQLAVCAMHHGVRFMVVAPSSTLDLMMATGDDVSLEERDAAELLAVNGQRLEVAAFNPVFDVTPADLIDVIVTEKGIVERPDTAKLAKLMCRKRLH